MDLFEPAKDRGSVYEARSPSPDMYSLTPPIIRPLVAHAPSLTLFVRTPRGALPLRPFAQLSVE